ncbi:MAG: energy transducer TonB, partial [Muribaculaceae bacterium]|nr:energy transducer TonB [Muribaculaceae bacterium]
VRALKAALTEKWTPGTVGGEPVDCYYTLPVMFSTKKEAAGETAPKKSEPYRSVEKMPQYPGGEAAMLQALMDELKYPENMAENDIKGNVIVTFTVTKEGTIDDIKIVRSAGNEALDAEAVRALKDGLTEKWTPGTVGGEAVDCRYTLPVMFKTKK